MADEEEVRSEGIERRPLGRYDALVLPVLAELVGVTCYVFVGLMVYDGFSRAITEGLTIVALMVIFGQLSGGHFNPAVTVGVFIAGGIRPVLVVFYVVAQIIGGLLGAALARAILPDFGSIFWLSTSYITPLSTGYIISYNDNIGWRFFGEFLLTGLWTFVFLMAMVRGNGKGKKLAPIAVGLTVLVGKFASMSSTGGDMNSVVSFGKSVVSSGVNITVGDSFGKIIVIDPWKDHYIFWLGPFAGGIIIALIYRLMFASNNRRWLFKDSNNQFANI